MNNTDKGYVSAWKRNHPKIAVSGEMKISPETLKLWLETLTPDEYGRVKLDFVLFRNTDQSERGPEYSGYIQLPRQQAQTSGADQSENEDMEF